MVDYDFRPMEPVPWPHAFTEPGWTFQVKWDGVRMLTLWSGDRARLVNRRGADRTAQYPEIAGLLGAFPAGTLVDGELLVLADGKPRFDLILRRDQRRQTSAIRRGMEEYPVTYAVFDLLYWEGRDIRSWPLEKRLAQLAEIWPSQCPQLHRVESFPQGEELFQAVGRLGLEGIVCKRLQSAYVPGKSGSNWRKVKHWRYLQCVVGGYTRRDGLPSALLLGLYGKEGLVFVGRAASGLKEEDWQALLVFLQAAEREESPFASPLPSLAGREIRWVEPHLAVTVRFMEWSVEGKLRAPVVVGFLPATLAGCGGEVPNEYTEDRRPRS